MQWYSTDCDIDGFAIQRALSLCKKLAPIANKVRNWARLLERWLSLTKD